jgi:peptidoglycan hydrolase-like protein with peptidoglycan-binding domain
MRRTSARWWTAVAVVTTCGAALTGCSLVSGADASTPAADSTQASTNRQTTPVVEGDLVDSKRVPGSLGYGTPVPLTAVGSGTVTWLPGFGDTIGRDGTLYSVDEVTVRSMHGTVPLWRTLEQGLRGADVDQLKDNLRALGYDVADDDRFDDRTRRAVARWQKDRDRPQTGTLGTSDVAFVPGDIRVGDLTGLVGAPAGEAVYGYTATTLVATATVQPIDLVRFPSGGAVQVSLPDGSQVPGTVQSVGGPPSDDEGSGSGGDADTTPVVVRLDAELPEGVSATSTVDLVVAGTTREGVLSVPVTALLAGSGGGAADDGSAEGDAGSTGHDYVVEVVQPDGTTREVPVTTGFFADGRVEVTGEGIAEGTEVVVPS